MSRIAEGLRKVAEARQSGTVEAAVAGSALEKLRPLRRDSLETPWALDESAPHAIHAVHATQPEDVEPPATPQDFTARASVANYPHSHGQGFAARSPLRTFSPAMRQQIEGLVERVFLSPSGKPLRSVAFAAIGADIHSASVPAAVAETLAIQTSGKVCVVDANFTTPKLHDCFGIDNDAGLADGLSSGSPLSDLVQAVDTNLYVLPAGRNGVRPSLTAESARAQMAQLTRTFKYVLVNVEPIASAGETSGVALLMDGVVLLIAAEQTRRDQGRSVADSLRRAGITIIGAVLINRRFPIPEVFYRWL